MADVFVSHAEEDAEVALEVARGLRAAGYSTWTYEEDSEPGTSYLLNVEEEIERCRAVVLIISPDSLSSDQVTKEVVRAHEGAKVFVPLRRGVSHVEFQQRRKEWRLALGAAVSIDVPPDGAASIAPRIAKGLSKLGILPSGPAGSSAGLVSPPAVPSPTGRGRAALSFALAIGALGLLYSLTYFVRNFAPPAGSPEAFLAGRFETARWANVVANGIGALLNAALLLAAWRAWQGEERPRTHLSRITAAMAAMPVLWLVVVWISTHAARSWKTLAPPLRQAMSAGTLGAFFVAFLPSLALFVIFRRRPDAR
jgi:hypothetical protein